MKKIIISAALVVVSLVYVFSKNTDNSAGQFAVSTTSAVVPVVPVLQTPLLQHKQLRHNQPRLPLLKFRRLRKHRALRLLRNKRHLRLCIMTAHIPALLPTRTTETSKSRLPFRAELFQT